MNIEPTEPYIYQPYGIQDKEHWAAKRIYAVSGISNLATIRGLTREEAEKVLAAILSARREENQRS